MAIRPVIFKPQLFNPEAINNYSGASFRCFTAGDTLPFEFTLGNADGSYLDVTDWTIEIAISKELDSASGLKVTIPLTDVTNGIFKGNISNTETGALTPGINYAIAKFITNTSEEYIIDMCLLEVYQNLDFTL